MSDTSEYQRKELDDVLSPGGFDRNWRLQIQRVLDSGRAAPTKTKWLSVSREQVEAIRELLDPPRLPELTDDSDWAQIRRYFPRDSVLYVVRRSADTADAASRWVTAHAILPDSGGVNPYQFRDISHLIARVYDEKRRQRDGAFKLGGGGMDVAYGLGCWLGRKLYDDEYAIRGEWV